MSRSLTPLGGNDEVMTPPELGRRIIDYLNPQGIVLEPCIGDGKGFFQWLIDKPSIKPFGLEIKMGLDFFNFNKKVDWIITNPPYSQLLKFLEHSFEIADNVAMLILLPNCLQKAKIKLAKKHGFYLDELIYVDNPAYPFPQFGFQLGVAIYKKGFKDTIKITDWTK